MVKDVKIKFEIGLGVFFVSDCEKSGCLFLCCNLKKWFIWLNIVLIGVGDKIIWVKI